METLYIVMPAYNEEVNIESVISAWYPVLDLASSNSKLVIADSGSTDRTHQILIQLSNTYKNLSIISDTGKQHGPKVIALYQYAIEHQADYIFQTDSDGQTSPNEFTSFWEMRNEYDAIIGNRVKREDGKDRAFIEHIVCLLLKIYFHVNVPDANAPFRLMKSELVRKYLNRLPSDYNLPNIMMTTYFSYYHEKLIFRDISFRSRMGGVNSINLKKIIKIGWNALGDFHKLRKEM